MPAKIDSSIAVQPGLGAGDLDEEVVALGLGVQLRRLLDRRRGVVGEQRRDLERDAAVDAVGALVDRRRRGRSASRRSASASSKKSSSARARVGADLGDLLVVGVAAGDRLVEDRRVRGQPGDRELVDVAGERAVAEHRRG